MKKNVRWWDRTARFLIGVFLVAWAIAGGPAWAFLGFYLLGTGSWGYCPIYSVVDYQPFEEE